MKSVHDIDRIAKATAQIMVNKPVANGVKINRGNLVMMLSVNNRAFKEDIKKENHPYLLFRNFKYVYIPKLYNISMRGKIIKKRIPLDLLEKNYDEMRVITVADKSNGYNTVINNSIALELIENAGITIRDRNDVVTYMDILTAPMNDKAFDSYSKTLVIPVDNNKEVQFSDIRDYRNTDLSSLVLTLLGSKYEYFKGMVLVFTGKNGAVVVDTSKYEAKFIFDNIPKIIANINRIKGTATIPTVKLVDSQIENEMKSQIADATGAEVPEGKDPFALEDEEIFKIQEIKNKAMAMNNREISPKEKRYKELTKKIIMKDGKTLNDVIESGVRVKLETKELPNVTAKDKSFTKYTFGSIGETYTKKVKSYDEAQNMASLGKIKENPLYVSRYKVEDVSTPLDLMEKHSVTFLDKHGVSHNISYTVPVMKNGEVYLNGTSKILLNQIISNPISKPKPDQVVITTSYNKAFCTRMNGDKITALTDMIAVGLKNAANAGIGKAKIKLGNVVEQNTIHPLIYTGIAKEVYSIKFSNDRMFIFSETNMRKMLKEDYPHIEIKENHIPFGIFTTVTHTTFVFMNVTDDSILIVEENMKDKKLDFKVVKDDRIDHYVINKIKELDEELYKYIMKRTPSTRLSYSSIKILRREIPIGVVLVYLLGLQEMFDRADIRYRLVPKRNETDRKPRTDKANEGVIELKDYFVVYDRDSDSALLCNGITHMDVSSLTLEEVSADRSTLARMLSTYVGDVNYFLYLENYDDLMIDPITAEWLTENNIAESFTGVLIYVNGLLADNSFADESDLSMCRLRREEVLSAIQYKVIADAYAKYNVARKRGSKVKMMVDKDAVTKKLVELSTLKELAQVSPMGMAEEQHSVSAKGLSGVNMDRAFDNSRVTFKRSYIGNICAPTPFGPNAGIIRQMSVNPNITSVRGHFKVVGSDEELEATEGASMIGITESMMVGISEFDSGQRTAMALSQGKHRTPLINSTPLLVTYGLDESIAETMDNVYSITAEKDGKVVSVDKDTVVVQYKDGTKDAFSLHNIQKNAEKSYYLTNRLEALKVGSKFKKGEQIATNPKFYKKHTNGKVLYSSAILANVAFTSDACTHEDTCTVSARFSKRAVRQFTKVNQSVFVKETEIKSFAKVGDEVKVGDTLIGFDDVEASADMLQYIKGLGGEADGIDKFNTQEIKAKYAGKIVDVKVYYTGTLDNYTDSMRKFIKSVKDVTRKKDTTIMKLAQDKHRALKSVTGDDVTPVIKGNINGALVSKQDKEVLVEYYIEYETYLGIGDKVVFGNSALKGIIGQVVPEIEGVPNSGLCTENGEPIDALFSWMSPEARAVISVKIAAVYNKALIGLAKRVKELL